MSKCFHVLNLSVIKGFMLVIKHVDLLKVIGVLMNSLATLVENKK
jgi:hypothetical protein